MIRTTLEQWRTLVAVVEAGSFAGAGELLHKSQSSVSYAVQQLEQQLGVRAFTLVGRKAELTPTGEFLYRHARHLLEDVVALERSAKGIAAGWEAELRIVVEIVFPTQLLLEALHALGAESPATRVEVIEAVMAHNTSLLADGNAELGIYGMTPPATFGEPLMRMPFVLVAHPDHPLHALGREVTERDLRNYRHLVVRESSPQRATPASIETMQRWTVGTFDTSILALSLGYGFAWLPEQRISKELAAGVLKRVPVSGGARRSVELFLVYANRELAGPATRRLAELIHAGARGCAGRADPSLGAPLRASA